MNTKDLPELTGPVVEPKGERADSIVILCHGYGSNGQDLISLAPHFQALLPDTAFVSPNAPEQCAGAPGGYQWFPLGSLSKEERLAGTYSAAPVLDKFIDQQLEKYGLEESRLVLLGFSQGTMMSLHVGLRRERQIAGILGYSGALTAPERMIGEMKSKPPVMVVHGDQDNLIPFPAMFETVGALQAAGLKVEHHLSRGVAHSIGPDGLQKGRTFIAKALG